MDIKIGALTELSNRRNFDVTYKKYILSNKEFGDMVEKNFVSYVRLNIEAML